MEKLFYLQGKIQNYAWGGTTFIPQLINSEVTGDKHAEYWLGAHKNAPSSILINDEKVRLNTFLDEDLNKRLGKHIAKQFGRLPFLFKVLDVKDMLSIQVHPTKIEAEKGYSKENKLGIPLTAAHRNYKDDNHKPEIMVALSEFWLLHGFLPKQQLLAVLKRIPEFGFLLDVFKRDGYFGLYKKVMLQSDTETEQTLRPLIEKILPEYKANNLEKSNPDYWAAKAVITNKENAVLDKGIYSIYFFNIVKVNKGDAVFQDAGIPHAYLEGQNMELMANSDNVLRGGLTPKHVDVPELLKHVAFEATTPNIMQGELQENKVERIYKSPAPDFELSKIELDYSSLYTSTSKTVEIFMVIEGNAIITQGETILTLKKGNSALVLANSTYNIKSDSKALLFKATA